MGKYQFGLRTKSVLALFIACLIALVPVSLIGWQVLKGIQEHFGTAYLRNYTLLKRQDIVSPIRLELALSTRLADSVITSNWLKDESNPDKLKLFFDEADRYRKDFANQSFFIAAYESGNYYFIDETDDDLSPSYTLKRDNKSDAWFYNSLDKKIEKYNINVNYDEHLKLTQIWFNIAIRDGDKNLGLAGSSLNLTNFINNFIITNEPGLTPIILAENGAIQAHQNVNLIANNQTTGTSNTPIQPEQTLAGHLGNDAERAQLAAAMLKAKTMQDQVVVIPITLDNIRQLLAISYIPDLQWYIVAAMDLSNAQFLDKKWLHSGIILLALLLISLLLGFAYTVNRIIIKPIKNLQQSATKIAQGNYAFSLPKPKNDELGDLSAAFASMSEQIRNQMASLEDKVAARTKDLTLANQQMALANKKINDSIQYASLIQHAILPDQQIKRRLGNAYCLIWQPRDVVGGDFYILYEDSNNYLIGILDCAGHGVPGALMTMLARAGLDNAVNKCGINDPAAILQELDKNVRAMLQEQNLSPAIATNIDAGLIFIDNTLQKLCFAGARIDLYWSNGKIFGLQKSCNRSIGDRRQGVYSNYHMDLQSGVTYTLTTDGFLDQAGGEHGYSFGNRRFEELLRNSALQPISYQANLFQEALNSYRGAYAQRDDITVLSFRF